MLTIQYSPASSHSTLSTVTSDDSLQVKVEPEEGTTSITGERHPAYNAFT